MAGKEFVLKHTVYLNETNAMAGVVYFANFVKWQGMTREEFFIKVFPNWAEIMKLATDGFVNMITVEEHSFFRRHAFFGDVMIMKLQTANLRKCSFDLIFKVFRNTEDELIYEGWQRLTFDDCKGNFIPIPEPIRQSILDYETSNPDYKKKTIRREKEKESETLTAANA
ncbi:MAG: hypothetical protein A3G33_00970 [Omnitrophica bacterium RIFCSPLOWO2_12_FULL_44_17]|uniref:Thioesterase domain-containing protein n=1 Tax=Candidatus Danuiimicrobium aquiferis TaxID=1801832 RepID=A0A1G1L2U7_9BACT|nr:MAG: hypothetical protein A3B72_06520 [Omnitrophica bacterium RIFCSPHIGHO2_02_FULL_45_28]OGW89665.1 MAG: hypothetical protein A3E74_04710 [Omnitrophica bacterium RIFCSPHIGHO2_12_FULL_44_12]OGW99475.1 MAG: hypothetical protein A3G33_00970 [Omnitrophica bacterium RIFCSPLOWO2_12_FULL_44_17]OGX04311.1 MAG: hypothetical protein A3J12_00680 [Omnitrophica bacterium RIFCSPLOWO2_02_FULL_44_11]